MISRIILIAVFAVISFVGTAYSQHVKVFDGRTPVLLSATSRAEPPTIDLDAGEQIKIQVSPAAGDERTSKGLVGSKAEYSAVPMPCDNTRSTTARAGGSNGRDVLLGGAGDDILVGGTTAHEPRYFTVKMKPVYVTSYQTSAGTCQLLTVKLVNGAIYRARLRFR
jgi:hypothetical protein